jgi:bifunctional DNA-binding transcriptional regulator/antitoxin component of YhaV-PrlF toxin-antitoxin module
MKLIGNNMTKEEFRNQIKPGDRVIIDKDFRNGGEVIIVRKGTHFCEVEDPETKARWETMIYRLSPIEQNNKEYETSND